MKAISLYDVWESYKIRFTLFDPLYSQNDEMWLQTSIESGMNAIKMERTIQQQWLTSKYGKPVQLWECSLHFQNRGGDNQGQFLDGHNPQINYSYVKGNKNQLDIEQVIERQPQRVMFV